MGIHEAGFTPVTKSPAFRGGDVWKSSWGFRYGVSALNTIKPRLLSRGGFTLIELLIGVTLSGMIFLAVTSLITVLLTSNTRSKQLDELEQAKNDVMQELSNTTRWGGVITITDNVDQDIVSIGQIGSEKTYQIQSGALVKDGARLTSDQITVTRFNVEDRSATNALKSLEIEIEMENKRFTAIKDSFRIVVSERVSQISV
jgi:prepilin-type N-terminal cleavage/methylation domain-containing protein